VKNRGLHGSRQVIDQDGRKIKSSRIHSSIPMRRVICKSSVCHAIENYSGNANPMKSPSSNCNSCGNFQDFRTSHRRFRSSDHRSIFSFSCHGSILPISSICHHPNSHSLFHQVISRIIQLSRQPKAAHARDPR
jgi:hypothetical protein